MNFQTKPILTPLRVLIVNPLTPAGEMTIVKILNGKVFGETQLIDLILLVYSNEVPDAEVLKLELIGCAFICYNKISVSSDLPSLLDADVFCFMTNFSEPNMVNLEDIGTEQNFDALYLIIKVANNLRSIEPQQKVVKEDLRKKQKKSEVKPVKPIIMADGLLAMDILYSLSKDLPSDIFFCPTAIPDVAKKILAEYLKVQCDVINDFLVWAANDKVLHVEVNTPIIIHDQVTDHTKCDWDMISKDLLRSLEHDHTQFNSSWLKKEFIEKIISIISKNPYGSIFKAASMANALKLAWSSRNSGGGKKFYCNLGVISDGSLETIKGYPYILPLVFCGDSWSVNKQFQESVHVQMEIRRINKEVKKYHQMLLSYCKKFLQENVINQAFIPDAQSSNDFSSSSKTSTI